MAVILATLPTGYKQSVRWRGAGNYLHRWPATALRNLVAVRDTNEVLLGAGLGLTGDAAEFPPLLKGLTGSEWRGRKLSQMIDWVKRMGEERR